MADALVERVTGQTAADEVPVEVQLVVTDRTLLAADQTPACLTGYGAVPAGWARRLVTPPDGGSKPEDVGASVQVWLRRLYTEPADGTLVAMDSRRRVFDGALRRFLLARDGGICRTPGCGAAIRHLDHVSPYAQGGATSAGNAQGLCVRCNMVKELAGWHARVVEATEAPGTPHTVEIITPTGHTYSGTAPPLLPTEPEISGSPLERAIELSLAA